MLNAEYECSSIVKIDKLNFHPFLLTKLQQLLHSSVGSRMYDTFVGCNLHVISWTCKLQFQFYTIKVECLQVANWNYKLLAENCKSQTEIYKLLTKNYKLKAEIHKIK